MPDQPRPTTAQVMSELDRLKDQPEGGDEPRSFGAPSMGEIVKIVRKIYGVATSDEVRQFVDFILALGDRDEPEAKPGA